MTRREEAEQFAESAPALNGEELESINALFPTYIFRRSRTRELWTTCCHQYMALPTWRHQSAATRLVMAMEHQREPKNFYISPPEEATPCPFCGKKAIVKELGRTGRRDNLTRWKRAVVLRWDGEALWATAYDCVKHYPGEGWLTDPPICNLVGVYRFRPGLAEATVRYYHRYPFEGIDRQDGPLTGGRWNVHGPFHYNSDYGMGYSVIGIDQIQQSPFRYCQAEAYAKNGDYFLELLEACCFYPRQIEMLTKAGMKGVVRDLIERGVKNAIAINWDEENPARAFKLNRQDMKAFLGTDRDIHTIELFRKLKGHATIAECDEWLKSGLDIRRTFQAAKKWNIRPEKLIRYLAGNLGCARYGGLSSMGSALRYWTDYLDAAEALHYPLHHENVLLPRALGAAHDEATTRHREVLEQERLERQREQERQRKAEQEAASKAYEERKADLEKKYSFELDGYVIRVPNDADEILAEGRHLQHCVGGYAGRHVSGKTTILFMRRAKHPDEPWLTIEMHGNHLEQIHGYRNEGLYTAGGRFAPDPRETYRDFIDTWLDWLEKGSKRDKDGRPKLPKIKKGAAA